MTRVSPARACAFAVLRRVFEGGAYADRAFAAEAAGLAARERSLAMALAYGAVQRRATLDHVAAILSDRRPAELDPRVLAALRLGLLQIVFLDGVAEHAAVNEAVELAKHGSRPGHRLVNAVLRRATREGRAILESLDDLTPAAAALRHSVPPWLAELWWEELGPERARSLLACVNQPAESALRVNTLLSTPAEVSAALGVPARPAPGIPEGLVLDAPFDAHGSALWRRGAIMPQARGSMLVARTLDPQPGERVLDLCAAPGAKTTHMAALMGDRDEVAAIELHSGRARALRRTCARMRANCVRVHRSDATAAHPGERFHRVLVDPPCSGLGTLQSRPDLRWRASPRAIDELSALQGRILAAAAAASAPGATLVYSVCTISRAESGDVIARFLEANPGFVPESLRQLLPDRDGTDGFFIARLRRG